MFLFLWTAIILAQEGENTGPMPYAEGSTSNFEVVVAYNDIEANKESKLIIYISDFKTNIPVGNAKLELDITGVDNSKINILPSIDPGIYEALVEFPEIKKYNFLINITSGETNDLIVINDVDIGAKEEVITQEKESKSFITIIKENFLVMIIFLLIVVLIAFVFYRIGKSRKTAMNINREASRNIKEIKL